MERQSFRGRLESFGKPDRFLHKRLVAQVNAVKNANGENQPFFLRALEFQAIPSIPKTL